MPNATHVEMSSTGMIVFYDDGSRVVARKTASGLWILPRPASGGSGGGAPSSGTWDYPFPAKAITPGRSFEPQAGAEGFHWGHDYGYPPATAGAVIKWTGPDGAIVKNAGWEIIGGDGNGAQILFRGSKKYGDVVLQYAHMASRSPLADKIGQTIKNGDIIGYIGNTGNSFGAHLHWQINPAGNLSNAAAINPKLFIEAQK